MSKGEEFHFKNIIDAFETQTSVRSSGSNESQSKIKTHGSLKQPENSELWTYKPPLAMTKIFKVDRAKKS